MGMAVFWHFFVPVACLRMPGTDLWIATRGMEWKPLRAIPFLLPEMPVRACPHKRLDKDAPGIGEKKKGGKKNV
ncbi:MAG: hypothetical protein HFH94_01730 [Lachnospiraceae bacterium]|jgi:hypothetical protein|nr:hypothetical protein [uncultured Acetatifactor sp.]MCI9218455.1 hypothetical protein [Lachnospiraceae bacterium]